ncbi:DNA cytosine methyltransferase [Vibrio breoganii]
MTILINKTVNTKTNKKTQTTEKRVWLEGRKLAPYFNAHDKITIIDTEDGMIIKTADQNEKATRSVSARKNGSLLIEVNECNSDFLKNVDEDQMLRIIVSKNEVKVKINQDTLKDRIEERNARIKHKVANDEEILKGSVFSGGGTLDFMGHEGLKKAGLKSKIRFLIDNDIDAINNLSTNLRHAMDDKTLIIQSDISLLNLGNNSLPQVDALTITPPCIDCSPAGISKKGNKLETSKTAALVYYYGQILERSNPAYVIIENVPNFMNSVSFQILASLLDAFGYESQIRVIDAHEEGFSLETRKRMFIVAESKGLNSGFDIAKVMPCRQPVQSVEKCLVAISDDDKCWSPKTGLVEKQIRDKEAGKGFMMQVYTPESTKVGTLRAQYIKSGSSDPLLAHPDSNKKLFRIFKGAEHCLIKDMPLSFIEGIEQEGVIHKLLGNGVSPIIAESLHYDLGLSIKSLNNQKPNSDENSKQLELVA